MQGMPRKPPMEIAASFNLDDAAEHFMHGVLYRFHTETPGLYTMHAIRRVLREVSGKLNRCAWTVTSFQPRRRGARREWMVITWDIDDVSIRFHPHASATAALAAFAAIEAPRRPASPLAAAA